MRTSELGTRWRSKIPKLLGKRVSFWTMWDNEFITVAGVDAVEPCEDNVVVVNSSSETMRILRPKIRRQTEHFLSKKAGKKSI